MELDYYEILEVAKDADGATIKKSYRKLAMKFHPDQNQGDKAAEEKFKLINEAYQVLSDSEKRAVYDRYGKDGLNGQGFRQSHNFEDIMDIFESAFSGFGGGSRRDRKRRKYQLDLEVEIELEFNEAVFGCKKEINYSAKAPCSECAGTGSKDKEKSTCKECNGQGQQYFRQGFMTYSQACSSCHGTGEKVTNPCGSCHGKGYNEVEKTVTVDIPEGVDDNNRIRATGKGNEDESGHKGDLYIHISVKEDEHFVRQGDDIYIEVPVFFTQALLGEKLQIPTLRGKRELKLKLNTRDKQHFIFDDEGVRNIHTKRKGRLIAQVHLTYPKKLDTKQKELLHSLQESFGIESSPHEESFEGVFDKIKNWFK